MFTISLDGVAFAPPRFKLTHDRCHIDTFAIFVQNAVEEGADMSNNAKRSNGSPLCFGIPCMLLLMVVLAAAFLGGCGRTYESSPAASEPTTTPSWAKPETSTSSGTGDETAVNLATIDNGGYVSASDSKVQDYRNVLKALRKKYGHTFEKGVSETEQERRIGEVLVISQKSMNEKGVKESLLDLGWHIDELFSDSHAAQVDLAQAATVYVLDKIGQR
jgi:hypothetical protein